MPRSVYSDLDNSDYSGNSSASGKSFLSKIKKFELKRKFYEKLDDFKNKVLLYKDSDTIVYRARCCYSNGVVVLKGYSRESLTLATRQRVWYEVQLLQEANCPFMAKCFDAFEDQGCWWLVMENCAAGDLYTIVSNAGGVREEGWLANQVVLPLLQTLAYLHAEGIIHRDIRPEHVLFTSEKVAKLSGFFMAWNTNRSGWPSDMVGTLDYVAPEVFLISSPNRDPNTMAMYDFKVDVWALGILVYDLLVGSTPFNHDDPNSTVERIVFEEPTFPDYLSDDAVDFISQALNKSPTARPTCLALLSHPFILKHKTWEAPSDFIDPIPNPQQLPYYRVSISGGDVDSSEEESEDDLDQNRWWNPSSWVPSGGWSVVPAWLNPFKGGTRVAAEGSGQFGGKQALGSGQPMLRGSPQMIGSGQPRTANDKGEGESGPSRGGKIGRPGSPIPENMSAFKLGSNSDNSLRKPPAVPIFPGVNSSPASLTEIESEPHSNPSAPGTPPSGEPRLHLVSTKGAEASGENPEPSSQPMMRGMSAGHAWTGSGSTADVSSILYQLESTSKGGPPSTQQPGLSSGSSSPNSRFASRQSSQRQQQQQPATPVLQAAQPSRPASVQSTRPGSVQSMIRAPYPPNFSKDRANAPGSGTLMRSAVSLRAELNAQEEIEVTALEDALFVPESKTVRPSKNGSSWIPESSGSEQPPTSPSQRAQQDPSLLSAATATIPWHSSPTSQNNSDHIRSITSWLPDSPPAEQLPNQAGHAAMLLTPEAPSGESPRSRGVYQPYQLLNPEPPPKVSQSGGEKSRFWGARPRPPSGPRVVSPPTRATTSTSGVGLQSTGENKTPMPALLSYDNSMHAELAHILEDSD